MPGKKLICPMCGSTNASFIVYGEPDMGYCYELARKGDSYVIGGCCVSGEFPLYTCQACNYSWGRFDGLSILPSIKSIKAHVGGFWGPNCNIESYINKGKLKRSFTHCDQKEFMDDEVDITSEAWKTLLIALRNCDFEYWVDEYNDPHICDGTQWSVEVQLDTGKKIKKWGSNRFPGRWKQFCIAMSKLAGIPFG